MPENLNPQKHTSLLAAGKQNGLQVNTETTSICSHLINRMHDKITT
jgi:hypothetical protein